MANKSRRIVVMVLGLVIRFAGIAYLHHSWVVAPEKEIFVRNGAIVKDAAGNPVVMGFGNAMAGQIALWTIVCGAGALIMLLRRRKPDPVHRPERGAHGVQSGSRQSKEELMGETQTAAIYARHISWKWKVGIPLASLLFTAVLNSVVSSVFREALFVKPGNQAIDAINLTHNFSEVGPIHEQAVKEGALRAGSERFAS